MSRLRGLLVVTLMAATMLLGPAGTVWADEEVKPEQLKSMYDSALAQLRAAQDRKNQLASENEQLQAKLSDLQKQLDDARQQAGAAAEKTFYLRSHHAAWQDFLRLNPGIRVRWEAFLEKGFLSGGSLGGSTRPTTNGVDRPQISPSFMDLNWPLSAAG